MEEVVAVLSVQNLESANELEQCIQYESRYQSVEEMTAQKLWSIGQSYYNYIDESDYDQTLDNIRMTVEQYAADVITFNADGYDGRNCSLLGTDAGVRYDWSFVGSMLFAITIYTTVGLCRIYLFIYLSDANDSDNVLAVNKIRAFHYVELLSKN